MIRCTGRQPGSSCQLSSSAVQQPWKLSGRLWSGCRCAQHCGTLSPPAFSTSAPQQFRTALLCCCFPFPLFSLDNRPRHASALSALLRCRPLPTARDPFRRLVASLVWCCVAAPSPPSTPGYPPLYCSTLASSMRKGTLLLTAPDAATSSPLSTTLPSTASPPDVCLQRPDRTASPHA